MSRKPQTCQDCSRRKIKCDKVIPCNNCTKRGAAHLCRRAEITHSGAERRLLDPSKPLSPGVAGFQTHVPIRQDTDAPINERILSLVDALSQKVTHLESKLDGLEPRKRSASEEPLGILEPPLRPPKNARTSEREITHLIPTLRQDDYISEHNSSDEAQQEVEDAATVLEFLAWGRLKDSNLTTGLREAAGAHDGILHPEKDIIQSTQAWGLSPSVGSTSHTTMETPQFPQIQQMLPDKERAMLLFEYHSDWLLFMHSSFHAPTFRRELEQFYINDSGQISRTSSGLQWAALLFAILCGSMTCAKLEHAARWGFNIGDQSSTAKQWYQASIECLNIARYQQNHSLYSVQTIASLTISAHILGFSNSQSVLLASVVRVAHSLGLHRLAQPKRAPNEEKENVSEIAQREIGKRVWHELATQDWFSVPFSETYCVNPLHFTTKMPLQCDENTFQEKAASSPAVTTYGTFLYRIAALMPALQDRICQAVQPSAKYDQVLHFDKLMRSLVTTQMPYCLNRQTPIDTSWPQYVSLARRCLTITSAHKIIMIHRRFLGMSFHDKRFAFTRRTCLAAAKTILNETKELSENDFPNIWTTQAFAVAAGIILSLDNFNRHQSAREYAEHRELVSQAIQFLSVSVAVSSIASRGTRLLSDLLAEEQSVNSQNDGGETQGGKDVFRERNTASNTGDRSLNVAAFVKKFYESDQPHPAQSPIATSHMPLWLQQDTSSQSYSTQLAASDQYASTDAESYAGSYSAISQSPYDNMLETGFQIPATARRHHESFAATFGQNFGENLDIRSLNWFDDLLGLTPSHSM